MQWGTILGSSGYVFKFDCVFAFTGEYLKTPKLHSYLCILLYSFFDSVLINLINIIYYYLKSHPCFAIVLFLLSSLLLYGMSIYLSIDLAMGIFQYPISIISNFGPDRVVINIFSFVYKYSFGYMFSFLLGNA